MTRAFRGILPSIHPTVFVDVEDILRFAQRYVEYRKDYMTS